MKHLDLMTIVVNITIGADHGLEPIRYLYKINLEDISHITIIIIDF